MADKQAWSQHEYYKRFETFWEVNDNVDRIVECDVATEEFIQKYEKPYMPVVIKGIIRDWKAQHKWTIEVYNVYLYSVYIPSNSNKF